MSVTEARKKLDAEFEKVTGSPQPQLSELLIDLIREVRLELRKWDHSADYSARKNLSIDYSIYKSME